MKLVMFSYGKKPRKKMGSSRTNCEKVLVITFSIAFTVLVIAQVALTNPYIRTFLTKSSDFEGAPLAREVFLFNEGKLSIGLIGKDRDESVKVLVNGEEVCVFSYSIVHIDVKDGDVVEVEGGSSFGGAEVQILSKSDNISTQCIGKKLKVDSNKKKLVKVNVGK